MFGAPMLRRSGLAAVAIAGVVLTVSLVVPAVGEQTSDRASVASTAKKALKLAKKANKKAKKALEQGAAGASEAVTTRSTAITAITTPTTVTSLNLPAGSWAVNARVDGAHDGVAGSTRLECGISGPDNVELDHSKVRLQANAGAEPVIFASVSLNGALTLAAPATVKVVCGSTAGTQITLTNRNMTAIKVEALTTQ